MNAVLVVLGVLLAAVGGLHLLTRRRRPPAEQSVSRDWLARQTDTGREGKP